MGLGLGLALSPSIREGVGGGPWDATRALLKTFLATNVGASNPHSLAAMASPPTITAAGGTLPVFSPTLSKAVTVFSNPSSFQFWCHSPTNSQGSFKNKNATVAATGGNMGLSNGSEAEVGRVAFRTDAKNMAFRLHRTTAPYRFLVDEGSGWQYADKSGTVCVNTTGSATQDYISLSFATTAFRNIMLEESLVSGFAGIYVGTADTVSAISAPTYRMATIGDSFVAGSGATVRGDGLAMVMSDYLGMNDNFVSGVGGEGYVATNGATVYKLADRLSADLTLALANGPLQLVVVPMSYNDLVAGASGVTVEVAACLTTIRTSCPAAVIMLVGAWDQNAPSAPVANFAAVKAAVQSGMTGFGGCYFIDAEGQAYTKVGDAIHPNDASHSTLGQWLATQARALIAA